jgi:hypothetical protein
MVRFEDITSEYAPRFHCLKDLAWELRNVLFVTRGLLLTETYKDYSTMYDDMIYCI